ncbi:zinc transporter 7 [Platysternon megacephalum]|uniref:Zinc transporter 7 n=1 Tax=Platysternon megacephalum TaxID=55544 RepID=A0A4D9E150_9SAUR|nr:zinc transporter 7 [Platysternon megacephalum]
MGKMLLWAGLTILLQLQLGSAYKLVCYFTNCSQDRPAPATCKPENVDLCFCTYMTYAFATMSNNEISPYEWNNDVLCPRFNGHNKKMVTVLAIGGWNFGTQTFTTMVAVTSRKTFIDSVIGYLRQYGFDGIDLDFEHVLGAAPLRTSITSPSWSRMNLDKLCCQEKLRISECDVVIRGSTVTMRPDNLLKKYQQLPLKPLRSEL